MKTIEEYVAERGISEELLEEACRRTQDKIDAYNLQQVRKACRMTQAAVAERMNVSQKRISALETGDLDAVQLGTLRRYVSSLGGTLSVSIDLPNERITLAQ